MKIESFIWLEEIIDKLVFKHHVETNEVEELFDTNPKIRFVQKEIAREKIFTWP